MSNNKNNNLEMVEAKLPPGFRFHPRDVELICDYLMKKIGRCEQEPLLLIEVDLNKSEPWDIPETACVGGKEWYFYSQRDRKYATGLRTNRATVSGYWKATGKDRPIIRRDTLVGMRKTLVFYKGRAPKGKKTDWVMHEFRLEGPLAPPNMSSLKEDWVLCRVFYKKCEVEIPSAKQGTGSSCEETDSSFLPPLMDPYITFDQSHTSNNNQFEQVPCFSIFTPNQTNSTTTSATTFSKIIHSMDPPILVSSTKCTTPSMLDDVGTCSTVPSFYFDKKVSNMDTSIPPNTKESSRFGEGISSESFLSDVGIPIMSMWLHY